MTALAQDSPRFRTPRRAVPGQIQSRFHRHGRHQRNSTGNFNAAKAPARDRSARVRAATYFPRLPRIGTAVGLSYFGPPPSTVNQSLVGPVQLLNTGQIDATAGTITIPLYLGHMKTGQNVWYILTDVDDPVWRRNLD